MTVHTESGLESSNQSKGRRVLGLMFLFFVLPLIVVGLMYQFDWYPKGSSQGDLVNPPRALQLPEQLVDTKGEAITAERLRDKWSMVYISDKCAKHCEDRLYILRQLHASMAKNSDRLQRVLLANEMDVDKLAKQYPDMIMINQTRDATQQLKSQFQLDQLPVDDADRLYLVDPLGNFMMSYSSATDPVAIRKDLNRLLAAAWAG